MERTYAIGLKKESAKKGASALSSLVNRWLSLARLWPLSRHEQKEKRNTSSSPPLSLSLRGAYIGYRRPDRDYFAIERSCTARARATYRSATEVHGVYKRRWWKIYVQRTADSLSLSPSFCSCCTRRFFREYTPYGRSRGAAGVYCAASAGPSASHKHTRNVERILDTLAARRGRYMVGGDRSMKRKIKEG